MILEGDAELVIKGVNRVEEDFSWLGQMIEDIKLILKDRKEWQVRFTNREGNNGAHMLAKHALSFEGENMWDKGGSNSNYKCSIKRQSLQ